MFNIAIKFADSSSSSGLGAFNINLKSFIFQLVTFVLVVLIFKKWILPPINKTLEERRRAVEKSLEDAKKTEEALAQAQAKAEEVLSKARAQADESLAEARKAAKGLISEAEAAGGQRAQLIIKEAEKHLSQEREKLRAELRAELADLVANATEKIIHEKLDAKRDMSLIERVIKGVAR